MQLRKTDNRQYESQAYLEDNPNPKRGKRKALEKQSVRASHVGHYVGGDIFGPFMNMAMHAVVDAYSGFGRSKPMQYSSKSPFNSPNRFNDVCTTTRSMDITSTISSVTRNQYIKV